MSINYLINKYGQDGIAGEDTFRFRIVKNVLSQYKQKYAELTGLGFITIMTKSNLKLDEKVVINGLEYYIYKVKPVSDKHEDRILYFKVELFENDFTHEVSIKQATLEGVHTNPAQERESLLEGVFVRIKQIKPEDSLSMLFYGDKKATHVITLKYIEGIENITEGCVVKTGNKVFEILTILNKNNILLLMYCQEVSYG